MLVLNRRSFFAASAAGISWLRSLLFSAPVEATTLREIVRLPPTKRKELNCTAYLKDGTRIGEFRNGSCVNESGQTIKAGTPIYLKYE